MIAAVVGVSTFVEEVAERHAVGGGIEQHAAGVLVEPVHLGQHPQVAGLGQAARRRQHAADTPGAGVLEPAVVAPHAERHIALLRGNTELVKQPDQVGVRSPVVDDEAGVDADLTVLAGHGDGVRVAAEVPVLLVECDLVAATGDDVGGRQAGDPAADDRDLHDWARGIVAAHCAAQPRAIAETPYAAVSKPIVRGTMVTGGFSSLGRRKSPGPPSARRQAGQVPAIRA